MAFSLLVAQWLSNHPCTINLLLPFSFLVYFSEMDSGIKKIVFSLLLVVKEEFLSDPGTTWSLVFFYQVCYISKRGCHIDDGLQAIGLNISFFFYGSKANLDMCITADVSSRTNFATVRCKVDCVLIFTCNLLGVVYFGRITGKKIKYSFCLMIAIHLCTSCIIVIYANKFCFYLFFFEGNFTGHQLLYILSVIYRHFRL